MAETSKNPSELLMVVQDVIVEEIERLKAQRAEIEERLAALQEAHHLVEDAWGDINSSVIKASADVGMTDRIREILATYRGCLQPTDVRDALVRGGFNLEGRSNPMAEVHTVLRRLVASGEVREADGFYTWITEKERRPKRAKAS